MGQIVAYMQNARMDPPLMAEKAKLGAKLVGKIPDRHRASHERYT